MSNLTLIIISILFLSAFGQKQKTLNDNLCPRISNVVCVKKVLLDISLTAKEITNIAHKIEQHIFEHETNPDTLNDIVDQKIGDIRSYLPTSGYHYQFLNVNNNINRTDLINLFNEENYAFSYLYNSIKNILKVQNPFSNSIDKFFTKILNDLQKNILCNYRNILYVYSETWISIDEVDGLEISNTQRRFAPSFLHHGYSIIIARLLDEWMKNVDIVVQNLTSKISK